MPVLGFTHSYRVSHQKQQVGRIRGRTDTVEGVSLSCSCKSTPLWIHYWGKEGSGITQKRPKHQHLAPGQRETHCVAKHSRLLHQSHRSASWYQTYDTLRWDPTGTYRPLYYPIEPAEAIPCIYGLPKIHKEGATLRPQHQLCYL